MVLVLAACLNPTGSYEPLRYPDGVPQRPFWARKLDGGSGGSWYQIQADLQGASEHSFVYVEDGRGVSPETAQAVADEFETRVYPLIREKFGEESDVDGNGRVTILLLDIVDAYREGESYVAGYFDPYHCLTGASYPYSNAMDMIFMDTDPLTPGSETFMVTLAHEFQHLANFNRTYIEGGGRQFDTWINEGLSSAAEYLYLGRQVQDKIDYFNADPKGDILNGVYFLTWPSHRAVSAYTSYATVYLFFQWLRIHASNGAGIYKDIVRSSHMDYSAVAEEAGRRGLDGSWPTLLSSWFIANALNRPSGLYGYRDEIAVGPPRNRMSGSSSSVELFPGEGIYIPLTSPFDPDPPSRIAFAGLTRSTGAADTDPPYEGEVLLVLNTDGNEKGAAAQAPIPTSSAAASFLSMAPVPEAMSAGRGTAVPSGPWPVDHLFPLPRRKGGGVSPGMPRGRAGPAFPGEMENP